MPQPPTNSKRVTPPGVRKVIPLRPEDKGPALQPEVTPEARDVLDSVEVGADNPFGPAAVAAREDGEPGFFDDEPSLIDTPDKITPPETGKAKSGPPSVSEWQDFLGRIVVRYALEGYLSYMLGEIQLTPQEEAKIRLSKQDLRDIASPPAVVISKQDWARKHGREIIAMADSYEAGLKLIVWMRHVSRIRRNHSAEIIAVRAQPRPTRNPLFKRQPRAREQQATDETELAQRANPLVPRATRDAQQQEAPLRLVPTITMPAPEVTIAETVRLAAANGSSADTAAIRKPSPPSGDFGISNPGAG